MDSMREVFKTTRVMIVDDQDPIRKAIRRILGMMGIRSIVECSDGHEALKEYEKQPFDLILLDLYMKKVSGFHVLETLRARLIGSEVPVIVITGESDKDIIVKTSSLGANDYLIKPFQMEALMVKIEKVLSQYYQPDPLDDLMREGTKAMVHQEYETALNTYTQAIKLNPESVRVRHAFALALYAMGRKDEAMGIFFKNIQVFPSYYKTYQALYEIYLSMGNDTEALKMLLKELEYHPKQPFRQIMAAKFFFKNKEYSSSVHHYRQALRENGKNKEALFGMGQSFAEIGDIEKSVYYYKRLRRQNPKERKALRNIVDLLVKDNKEAIAETMLRDERRQNPQYIELAIEMVYFYQKCLHQYDKAYEIMDKTLHQVSTQKTKSREDFLLLGEGFKLLGEYRKAFLSYTKAGSLGIPPEKWAKESQECLIRLKKRSK